MMNDETIKIKGAQTFPLFLSGDDKRERFVF